MMQKTLKLIETLAHEYSSEITQLSNDYQHDMSLNGFQRSLGPWA